MTDSIIENIRQVLSQNSTKALSDNGLTPAGVMLLLCLKDDDYFVILNKRSDYVEYHKREISFPGGVQDPEDRDILATALRETHEEMGILPSDIDVLGRLDEVATNSRFGVTSFVGTIPFPYEFKINAAEIAEVVEAPLSSLMDSCNLREESWVDDYGYISKIYSYAQGGHLIYGATAQILDQFMIILSKATGQEVPWTST